MGPAGFEASIVHFQVHPRRFRINDTRIACLAERKKKSADILQHPKPRKGILDNGKRFVLYRLALYTNGFKQYKSLADHCSVDRCYILPLGKTVEAIN